MLPKNSSQKEFFTKRNMNSHEINILLYEITKYKIIKVMFHTLHFSVLKGGELTASCFATSHLGCPRLRLV
jgi:hypothetical protein